MQHRSITLISCALSCLAFSSGALAHHSSAPHFDRDSEVVVEGRVTELKFVNPHAYLYFGVEQDGELVNWRCELSGDNNIRPSER